MQTSSIRKFSTLGLVLIGASAVTAAVLSKNDTKNDSSTAITDRLVASTIGGPLGGLTCIEAVDDDCNATAPSSTTNANTGGTGIPPTNGTSTSDAGLDGSSAANTTVPDQLR